MLPEWVIIALAIGSAISVYKYFGGWTRVLTRLWIVAFYAYIWMGPDPHDTPILARVSRYGLALLFIADIIPAIIAKIQRRKWRGNYGNE